MPRLPSSASHQKFSKGRLDRKTKGSADLLGCFLAQGLCRTGLLARLACFLHENSIPSGVRKFCVKGCQGSAILVAVAMAKWFNSPSKTAKAKTKAKAKKTAKPKAAPKAVSKGQASVSVGVKEAPTHPVTDSKFDLGTFLQQLWQMGGYSPTSSKKVVVSSASSCSGSGSMEYLLDKMCKAAGAQNQTLYGCDWERSAVQFMIRNKRGAKCIFEDRWFLQ